MVIKGTWGMALSFTAPIIKAGSRDFALAADWTPAAGDVKLSKDNGNVADVGTLPSIQGGTGAAVWEFVLSASEMEVRRSTIQVVDAATKVIEDQAFYIETGAGDPGITFVGKATAGAAGSITLPAGASSVNNAYRGQTAELRGGTGAGTSRVITAYDGTTKVATVEPNWPTTPDNTSIVYLHASAPGPTTDVPLVKLLGNSGIKKNTALANFAFTMFDSTNHAPAPSLTVTAQRRIDAGSFGACANSVTEVANGVYSINLAASDLNGDVITLKLTATGADQLTITLTTTP